MDLVGDFDINKLQLFSPVVSSIALSADSNTILFQRAVKYLRFRGWIQRTVRVNLLC